MRNNMLKVSKSDNNLGPTATTYFKEALSDRMRKIYKNSSAMLGHPQIPFNSKVPKLLTPTRNQVEVSCPSQQYQAIAINKIVEATAKNEKPVVK